MQRAGHSKRYNARNPHMSSSSRRRWGASCYLIFSLWAASAAWATDWRVPEQQLAGKIAAVTGPGSVSLTFANLSSLGHADAEQIRLGLISELAALGVHLADADQAAATAAVSLSEDLQNYVWVAEIRQGTNEPAVVLVSLPRPDGAASSREASEMSLRKSLLWSQPARILDVAVTSGSPQHMILLDENGVAIYKMQDGRWQQEQVLPVTHPRPWPRDLRGRLVFRKDHLFDAYLPGVFCRSAAKPPLMLTCVQSDDPWFLPGPLTGNDPSGLSAFYSATRNFFTGALAPGIGKQKSAPAFYSAAALPREQYTLWLFAAVDGQMHMLDGISDQNAGNPGWGSDIAAVHTACGSGWQVLATGADDESDKNKSSQDSIRAYELSDREAVPASRPLEFSGRVTALWSQSDESSAVGIIQISGTGRYEAYQLTVACGQ
jgi:hypothetical protein